MTMPTADLLWPKVDGPEDLTDIERVPLEDRGLPESSYAVLARAAARWPDRPAVSFLPDAQRWEHPTTRTFAELAAGVRRVAAALGELGVGRRDAVAIVSVNCEEMLTAVLAAEAVGVAAPVNPALSAEHAEQLVRLAGARVIVAAGPELDDRVWALARSLAERTAARALLALRPTAPAGEAPALAPLDGVEVAYLEDLAAGAQAAVPADSPPHAEDLASYLHTGGTTSTPKLAARTHRNEVANAWMIAASGILDEDSVLFAGLPLFHTNALLVTVLAPLLRGQHVVWAGPLGYRDPALYQVFWKVVERYGISAMSGVPTVYAALAQVPVDADISSLRMPIVGAAPLPPAVAEAFRAHTGVELCEGYGLSEGTCASSRNFPGAVRPGTVGQRLPYQEMRAARIPEDGGDWELLQLLPDGEVGTLVIKGPNVFAGYLVPGPDGPVPSQAGVVRDGWLDTGDLGSVDADGYVRLAGRAKDLIIRGGHNIDPAMIEDALLEHPAVAAAAAVGRPDAHAGEVPVAYVVLAPGAAATVDELTAWAATHVAEPAAVPRVIEVIDEIPHTAVGKPYKPELRRRAAQDAARAALAGATGDVVARLVDGQVVVAVSGAGEAAAQAALAPLGLRWVSAAAAS
jgi:fatty-acyl-CoA synthase